MVFYTIMFQCWLLLLGSAASGGATARYDKSKLCIEKNEKIINQSMKICIAKIKGYFCSRATWTSQR